MKDLHPVFVYGTLQNGCSNHALLAGSISLGFARTDQHYVMRTAVDDGGRRGIPFVGQDLPISSIHGEVYLVDDTKLRPLQYGKSRLLERNPQPIGESSATRITVQRGEDVRTFTQQNIEDRAQAMWTLDGQPETEHPVAGAWFGKVFKLRAKSYVAEADIPANLTDIFSYTVSNDEREWTISVKRDEVGDAWYAETDFLRATIELTSSLAADAVVDLDGLFQE